MSKEDQAKFKQILVDGMERNDFANRERAMCNRPTVAMGGFVLAVQLFPDLPKAGLCMEVQEKLWNELRIYGDTTEVNWGYPIFHLRGMMDYVEVMGKDKVDGKLLRALGHRYLEQWQGSGILDGPNCHIYGCADKEKFDKVCANPWYEACQDSTLVHF